MFANGIVRVLVAPMSVVASARTSSACAVGYGYPYPSTNNTRTSPRTRSILAHYVAVITLRKL
eukprot:scaffold142251_cov23-Prasinocladus_malaysianus.AAC.1